LLIAGSLMSQGSINTIPSWDGINAEANFGVPDTATYGQTITVAAGSGPLASFGFEIGNCTANVSLRGEVYAWDGTKATGPSLFESSVTSVPASSGFQLVTFNTGGLNLTPGAYVLFATTSRDQTDAPLAGCTWGRVLDTVYPGGTFVFESNGTDTSLWTAPTALISWHTNGSDLAFQANFSAVPGPGPGPAGVPAASPATLLLGVAGVIGLGLFGLSRFRTAR
jgi:hypothetical protein